MDIGDTAFVLVAAMLVMFMTPGLGLFYGGLERRKNMVSNIMNSVFNLGIGIMLWVALGFTLTFCGDNFGIIGTLDHFMMIGIGMDDVTGTIPTYIFAGFQMMFAVITPVIITGSVAGRMRFKAVFIFVALWSLIVYYPMAHMVWGGGFIGPDGIIGAIDFAGGDVIHISSGVSGLVLSMVLGRRLGLEHSVVRTHNIPFVVLGGAIVWFGWFGFNVGSALAASTTATLAFMNTATASGSALFSWMLLDIIVHKKPTAVGAITGAIAGLVAITPGAGFVPIQAAMFIGFFVSPVCFGGMYLLKKKLRIDDALDAFGCHGIGGIYGGIMTGIFTNPAIAGMGGPGLIYGSFNQFGRQVLSIVITIVIVVIGTLICAGITRIFTPLRVEKNDEQVGLDLTQHNEAAYPSFTGLD
ncbi:MAG: ammonium transporter [Peptococcaceae bacterium]|jgi:Amt family ammonium transporter|nr:ammonium transporter [Peptococcaceae bacterium]